MKKVSNLDTFADVIDRLIVEVNKLAFFENAKREESVKTAPDAELITKYDRLSRDCCEFRSLLKNKINTLLEEIVETGEYDVLKEVRTFRPPNKDVGELLADMCYQHAIETKKELKHALEHMFENTRNSS